MRAVSGEVMGEVTGNPTGGRYPLSEDLDEKTLAARGLPGAGPPRPTCHTNYGDKLQKFLTKPEIGNCSNRLFAGIVVTHAFKDVCAEIICCSK